MKFQIFADTPCVMQVDGQIYELDDYNFVETDMENSIILLQPLNKNLLPIAFKPSSASAEHFKILRLENLIILHAQFVPHFPGICKMKTFGEEVALLTNYPHMFYVGGQKPFRVEGSLENVTIKKLSNFIILSAEREEKGYMLVFANNKFYEFDDNFEENGQKVTGLCKIEGIAKHGLLCNLERTNFTSELVYLKKEPKIPKNENSRAFAFFEAVKQKDFNLAKIYLSSTLKKVNLEKFFGEIEHIEFLGSGKFALLPSNKIYSLSFTSSQISDIVEE